MASAKQRNVLALITIGRRACRKAWTTPSPTSLEFTSSCTCAAYAVQSRTSRQTWHRVHRENSMIGCRTVMHPQGRYPWKPSERKTEIRSHSAFVFGVLATNRGVVG